MTSIRAQAIKSIFRLASVVVITAIAVTAHAQAPIRIGASVSLTGSFGALGQNHLRGHQLCINHANETGGVLGRKLELIVEDDQSQAKTAVGIYERLITQLKVDAVLSPYSSPITDAVADVTEKHRMLMVAAAAASTSIYKKGRRYIFMAISPAEAYLSGLVEMAAAQGLKTIAILYEDTLFPRSIAQGAVELAKKRGLQVVHFEAYAKGSSEFASILGRVRAKNPDVLGAATYFEDAIALTRHARELDVNPKMLGLTSGVDLPKFHEVLGRSAEFIYGPSQWQIELAATRAGGLIPMARQYPGAHEFVEAHRKTFAGADDPTYHTAEAYGACQILLETVKRAGSLNSEKLRDVILKMELNTAFGAFKVDQDGFQIGHKMVMFQWQDGKKVIVWPQELAPNRARFPTPPWNQRK